MNLLFLTQSQTLDVFYEVMLGMGVRTDLGRVGFYVADSAFYDEFKSRRPEISSGSFELLKEWEIIGKSRVIRPDILRLRAYEEKLGDPVLWNALIADRRIYLGKRATLEQDYGSRFTHEEMMAILQVAIEEMEALFDRVQPDAVIGFICVTIGEYLAYLIAKNRNVPFIDLRPTRIKNYFFAGEGVLEPSDSLHQVYRRMKEQGVPEPLKREVATYLEQVRKTHAMYEGVIFSSKRESNLNEEPEGSERKLSKSFKRMVSGLYLYNFGKYRHDNSHRGVLYPLAFSRFKRPTRLWLTNSFLKRHYIGFNDLNSIDYVFFPLHKEPEVTLLVYGRPYLNQIEVIRNLARSLPVGTKVVVKEHPAGTGYHPLRYYQKLLEIPNVVLAHPKTESRELVENAKLVSVISGSVALEAIMLRKPVIHFGQVPFGCMPNSMIRRIINLDDLPFEIGDLLKNYAHDEDALSAYIAAIIRSSVRVDFYSVLLERKGVFRPDITDEENAKRKHQIQRLTEYLLQKCSLPESGRRNHL